MRIPFSALALASILGTSGFAAANDNPPEITAFSVSPAAVDITSADATVQVTVHITDDDSGFSYANLYLYGPGNKFVTNIFFQNSDVQSGGTNLDGTYVIDVTIPRYGLAGDWRLEAQPVDHNGNSADYGASGVPFPIPGNEIIAVANTGTVDSTPPLLASISISPSTVDVTSQDQTISVSVNATDDLSGLRNGFAILNTPTGSDSGINRFYQASSGTGTPQNGTYTFDMTLPRGSTAGTWTVVNHLRDVVGNFALASGDPGAELTVINNGNAATGDLSDACDATQYVWTTAGDEDWFFQTATTHDGVDAARSGPISDNGSSEMQVQVTGPGTLTFWWKVDSHGSDTLSVDAAGPGNSQGISGSSPWVQVALSIEAGPQTVTWTYTKDSSDSSGEDAGWVDQVYFAAGSDSELPTLQYINISPDPASVASGQVDVTVTFGISDDHNGVDSGYVDLYDPSDNNYNGTSFDSSNRISGDEFSGIYEVNLTIYQSDLAPSGSYQQGTWRADVYVEEMVTFDSRNYGPYDDPFPNPGDEVFSVTGGSSGQLGILAISSFTPDPVDITSAMQPVTIDFVLDDPFDEFGYGYINLRDANNQYVNGFYFDSSGGSGGQYSVVLTIPRYGPPGSWSVDFNLYDQADNVTYVSGSIQNPGDNLLNVTNTGTVDSAAPVLTSISITPGAIDTSTGSADITITAAVSDDLVGMDYAYIDFYNPAGAVVNSLFRFVNDNEIVGGSFSVTQTIPMGSVTGIWRCEVTVRDLLGNIRVYGPGSGTYYTPFPVSADAQFTVGTVAGGTFEEFTNLYSLTGDDALPASNPDHDWANNALELILGLDPTQADQPDPALYQSTRVGNELRLDFKIDSALTATPSGNFLSITKAGSSPAFQVTGQAAATLAGPWINTLPQPLGGGVYRVTLPVGPNTTGFSRLQFVDP
jgi:hypothetical protein